MDTFYYCFLDIVFYYRATLYFYPTSYNRLDNLVVYKVDIMVIHKVIDTAEGTLVVPQKIRLHTCPKLTSLNG